MRILLGELWDFVVDLWDTGNFYIRLAIVLVLGWPVALALAVILGVKGDTAVALALMPAGALVLLLLVIPPMLSVVVMALPEQPFRHFRGLRQIQLPSRIQRLRALKRVLNFLTLVAGTEVVIGVYLAGVPVGNDPKLLWWLLAFTVIFATFWSRGYRRRWFRLVYLFAVLAITTTFFFGGRETVVGSASRVWESLSRRAEAEEVSAASPVSTITTVTAVVTPYELTIRQATEQHGVPADLVKAVIREESGFDPNAKNPDSGAQGLMQVLPSTAEGYGVGGDLFDPERNIDVGTRHLAELLKRYRGNVELALAAYNAGQEPVDKLVKERNESFSAISSGLPAETRNYVPDVMEARGTYTRTLTRVVLGPIEEFGVNKGGEIFTSVVGPGTRHRVQASHRWIVLSRDDQGGTYQRLDGKYRLYELPAGSSVWDGGGTENRPLLVRGLENGTFLRFERLQ